MLGLIIRTALILFCILDEKINKAIKINNLKHKEKIKYLKNNKISGIDKYIVHWTCILNLFKCIKISAGILLFNT